MKEFGTLISIQIDNTNDEHIVSFRRTGHLHLKKGVSCEDFVLTIVDPDTGACFAAVADGVSSSKYSRFGSRIAG